MKARRILQVFVLTALLLSLPIASFGQVSIGIAVNLAPPVLPVYAQPICPAPNLIWTPGYWAWNGSDFFWVPGTWVAAPAVGLLWTPGWWGWGTGGYLWHAGYWGPHIGFYGGVNYGFGYYGTGYAGGAWRGNTFFYNTAVSRVNTTVIRNVYVNRTVINNVTVNRVSFNGGRGGIVARPTPQEQTALNERRMGPVGAQMTHEQVARQDRGNFFKSNNGAPAHAALARPAASINDFRSNASEARPVAGTSNRPVNNAARPEAGQPGTMNRPSPAQRATPTVRPTPETRATATARPTPETRPTPAQPQQQRPVAPQQRPAVQPRPEPQQQAHYSAQPRPEPQHTQPQAHPAPESRPESQPHASEPHGEEHPHR
jgi:hypothetical protein